MYIHLTHDKFHVNIEILLIDIQSFLAILDDENFNYSDKKNLVKMKINLNHDENLKNQKF